ncbi:hypothetical protein N7456_006514 [Penicillium angulare]|uniref:MARVEL domain-containing protein n=1 Tax=Penicillium angulare TaxID=116970 RepID=A0A9W9FI88_9EURO|nr:hypothetical protein N7456_006514 [Penicillium angulare]
MFVAAKLLKTGYTEAKKHKAKKQAKAQAQYPNPNNGPYPEPYQMSGYPQGVAPGVDVRYQPDTPPPGKRTRLVSMITSAVRFLQFVFGLAVIGLYGQDVHHDHEDGISANAKWIYAVIVGILATSTSGIHMVLPFIIKGVNNSTNPKLQLPQFVWEFILCILWLTLFGIFGKMYIGVHADDSNKSLGDAAKINRMRHAAWVDLVNLLMWVFTASWALMRWLKNKRAATESEMGYDVEKENQI